MAHRLHKNLQKNSRLRMGPDTYGAPRTKYALRWALGNESSRICATSFEMVRHHLDFGAAEYSHLFCFLLSLEESEKMRAENVRIEFLGNICELLVLMWFHRKFYRRKTIMNCDYEIQVRAVFGLFFCMLRYFAFRRSISLHGFCKEIQFTIHDPYDLCRFGTIPLSWDFVWFM